MFVFLDGDCRGQTSFCSPNTTSIADVGVMLFVSLSTSFRRPLNIVDLVFVFCMWTS